MCYIFEKCPLSRKSLWCLCLWLHTVNTGMHGILWMVILGSTTTLFVLPDVCKWFSDIYAYLHASKWDFPLNTEMRNKGMFSFSSLGKNTGQSRLSQLHSGKKTMNTIQKFPEGKHNAVICHYNGLHKMFSVNTCTFSGCLGLWSWSLELSIENKTLMSSLSKQNVYI